MKGLLCLLYTVGCVAGAFIIREQRTGVDGHGNGSDFTSTTPLSVNITEIYYTSTPDNAQTTTATQIRVNITETVKRDATSSTADQMADQVVVQEATTEMPLQPSNIISCANQPNSMSTRITSAPLNQFPYVVHITSKILGETVECGGTLITDNFVITAAECVALAASITVVGGVIDPLDPNGQVSSAKSYVHPDYRRNFKVNNIALLKLFEPFYLGTNVNVLKVSKGESSKNLEASFLRGFSWGTANECAAKKLTYMDMKQLSKEQCDSWLIDVWVQYPEMDYCIDAVESTKEFCEGSKGGAVMITNHTKDGGSYLVGVLSEHQFCPSRFPMAYTSVGPYINWIKTYIKNIVKY